MQSRVIQGDCIEVLRGFGDNTFDSVVTDPPYGLEFMGKEWDKPSALWRDYDNDNDREYRSDGRKAPKFKTARPTFVAGSAYQAWCEEWARECLRVLKPGGYLLAFGGTRTYHRLACAVEDAGFEIRDSLHWIYGSGFPKSRDISKAIDSEAGAEREVIGVKHNRSGGDIRRGAIHDGGQSVGLPDLETAPATEAAKAWAGWGTALKPAHEPIVMARKPLSSKTVAANVLEFGTGGINVDGCRIPTTEGSVDGSLNISVSSTHEAGRWPPNVVLTHSPDCKPTGQTRVVESSKPAVFHKAAAENNGNTSAAYGKESRKEGHITPGYGTETLEIWDCANDCPVAEIDRQSGTSKSTAANGVKRYGRSAGIMGDVGALRDGRPEGYDDSGGASRFFPCFANHDPLANTACFKYQAKAAKKERPVVDGLPGHPTVKPVAIMQWLVKLVTPPGGYVLDPFAGTGTTAEACHLEGFDYLLIERDADSIRRIEKRMSKYGGGDVNTTAVWTEAA